MVLATLISFLFFVITLALCSSPKVFFTSSLCLENPLSVLQASRALSIPSSVGTVVCLVPALTALDYKECLISLCASCVCVVEGQDLLLCVSLYGRPLITICGPVFYLEEAV